MRSGTPAKALLLGVVAVFALLFSAAASGELVGDGNLRVSFQSKLSPKALPRVGDAPIAVSVAGKIKTTDGTTPPALRSLQIAVNRHGRLDTKGLPTCKIDDVQPSTTQNAMAACGDALVGTGRFSASVAIPEQSPFPSEGKVLAFNGTDGGKPVILAHVYGTEPVPTSFTLPIRISHAKGKFGTLLSASLPEVGSDAAVVTGISLDLHRNFTYRGKAHSYLSAGCPAPESLSGVLFPLAKATFKFETGQRLSATANRSCSVKKR